MFALAMPMAPRVRAACFGVSLHSKYLDNAVPDDLPAVHLTDADTLLEGSLHAMKATYRIHKRCGARGVFHAESLSQPPCLTQRVSGSN